MSGFILESRSILNSDIWKKPPMYFKVWHYLLLNAQHSEYKGLKRGQLFTSIDEIREACSYYVGYRKETPSRKEIYGVLNWLRNPGEGNTDGNSESPMIVTTKVTHGMVVSIVNYNIYQDASKYEGNNEGTANVTAKSQRRSSQGNNINKNVKNGNNEKNVKESETAPTQSADKKRYGEYKNVLLTDDEYKDLSAKYGLAVADMAIKHLDEYIAEKGYKSNSHFLAIQRWVINALQERKQIPQEKKPEPQKNRLGKFGNFPQRAKDEQAYWTQKIIEANMK